MNNPCVHIFYNLDEMDQFSEKTRSFEHTQEETNNVNSLYLQKKMSQ